MSQSHSFDKSYLEDGKGFKSWFFTHDHKRLGVMYLWAIGIFFVLAAIASFLIRFEHLTPGQTIVDAQTYNVLFTLHGAVMVFLFIVPGVAASFGNFLIPLMIGARDVIFPKLNLYSFWIYCAGAIIFLIALAAPADTGWTFYTPYSIDTGANVILVTFGVFVLGFSSILTGINFIVSIHKLRAPGLTWDRLPLFCWAAYATSLLQVLATPVVGITLLLLIGERYFGLGFFDPAKGGDPVLFQHFFWFYSHPAVYIMILPAMGIISEVIPVFSRKPIFGYKAIAYSSLAIALISFLVWGHHMFVSGQSKLINIIFSVITFAVAVPTAIKVFNWLWTMYKGSIELSAAMLYSLAFIFLFTIGGLTGLFLGALAADVHLHDTYFVVAHMHYVMIGGTVFGLFSAIHFWYPKMWGKMFDEFKAKIAFVLIFIGFNVVFFPQFILGTLGMPRRYFNYSPEFTTLHQISTYGTWILGIGFIIMLYALLKPISDKAEANPYKSASLEWSMPSPPPTLNFEKIPTLTASTYDYGTKLEQEA
ncbi:MAG: cbb3-type cytochrome c oxidase subunit I [Thermodesulfobacteriota bacterium]|jgi:cytochrome c oxidase subunit 1|nr:cbb3-type cytochrome c oxidase subunit I [Candidatus Dadabacteria bacterium]|tara:strand:+ start:16428 stop:18029 length:1602 start_codon:yes stop_codon:yes gene_type:complete